MLLVRAAHAITIGSMVAVSLLQAKKRTLSEKQKWRLRIVGLYFALGYTWTMPLRLFALGIASLQGNVATADGFLIILSERTENPRPSTRHVVVGILAPVGLLIGLMLFIWYGDDWLRSNRTWVIGGMGLTFSAFLANAWLRSRGDGLKGLEGMVRIEGFVPVSKKARTNGVRIASAWLKQQEYPIGWVADAGLLNFYTKVLAGSGATPEKINDGWPGFWGCLRPPRYRFKKS